MNNIINSMLLVPQWVEKSFPVIRIVIAAMVGALAIAMIVLCLMQESSSRGAGAVTGDANTFYNRNKGKSLQGKIKLATIISASIIVFLCILYIIVVSIYAG